MCKRQAFPFSHYMQLFSAHSGGDAHGGFGESFIAETITLERLPPVLQQESDDYQGPN